MKFPLHARELAEFADMIARLETEEEVNVRTDYEGMSGDDAVETLGSLIRLARALRAVQS